MAGQLDGYLRAVTELVFVSDEPAPADAIFLPGCSRHIGHILRAARLYRDGFAPLIVPSGRFGVGQERFRLPGWDTECDWMMSVLACLGVPDSAILPEREASFTWDNARRSRGVCDRAGLRIREGILCCRPFHARRALLYYQTAFPETKWRVCPSREADVNAEDWHMTAAGRKRILGEIRRLGDQIGEQLEDLIRWNQCKDDTHP
jgi:uncharacterized SAM-binding protein YcdF (DUF218 family)